MQDRHSMSLHLRTADCFTCYCFFQLTFLNWEKRPGNLLFFRRWLRSLQLIVFRLSKSTYVCGGSSRQRLWLASNDISRHRNESFFEVWNDRSRCFRDAVSKESTAVWQTGQQVRWPQSHHCSWMRGLHARPGWQIGSFWWYKNLGGQREREAFNAGLIDQDHRSAYRPPLLRLKEWELCDEAMRRK